MHPSSPDQTAARSALAFPVCGTERRMDKRGNSWVEIRHFNKTKENTNNTANNDNEYAKNPIDNTIFHSPLTTRGIASP